MKDSLRIGIFQIDSIWNDPEGNISQLELLLSSLDELPDLMVLPEMWTTGFVTNPSELNVIPRIEDKLLSICKKYGVDIVGSMVTRDGQDWYNRAIFISDGKVIGTYDKQYLFSPSGENKSYKAGVSCPIINYKGWNIKLQICYDLRFPESVRGVDQPDLILYMANWPTSRIAHWKHLLIARAIENQCYVIGCNRTGRDGNGWTYSGESQAIDCDGNSLRSLSDDVVYGEVSISKNESIAYREKLPFYKDKKIKS